MIETSSVVPNVCWPTFNNQIEASVMAAGGYETTGRVTQIPLIPLGWSVSAFFVISYVLCVLSGLIVPGWSMHQPWLQFFPGFEWLTVKGFIIGLLEAVVYGWYVAFLFGWLFNFFAVRG